VCLGFDSDTKFPFFLLALTSQDQFHALRLDLAACLQNLHHITSAHRCVSQILALAESTASLTHTPCTYLLSLPLYPSASISPSAFLCDHASMCLCVCESACLRVSPSLTQHKVLEPQVQALPRRLSLSKTSLFPRFSTKPIYIHSGLIKPQSMWGNPEKLGTFVPRSTNTRYLKSAQKIWC